MDNRLRGYQIVSQVGAGTDGVSYRAEREEDGQPVEYRVMTHAARDPDRERYLIHRLKLASMLDQPSVTRVLEVWQTSPIAALVELGSGVCLAERLDHMTLAQRTRVASQIADALAAAHRLGLPHGNLTARHIQCPNDNTALIDFAGGDTKRDRAADELAQPTPQPNVRPTYVNDIQADIVQLAQLVKQLLTDRSNQNPDASDWDVDAVRSQFGDTSQIDAVNQVIQWVTQALDEQSDELLVVQELATQLSSLAKSMPTDQSTATDDRADSVEQTAVFDAEPLTRSSSKAVPMPSQLGRFRLLEKIGAGGMGTVYRGEDLADGTTVAIKVLLPSLVADRQARVRFMKEARLLGEVHNSHVVRLLEANEDDGTCFIAMEFVDGTDLKDFLVWSGPLAERTALKIAADIARGLVGAHEVGIVHRDIKPANILLAEFSVDADGEDSATSDDVDSLQIKLSDFGLARHVDQSASMEMTRVGSVIGTPTYMAPEQCGASDGVTPATDVYSLGITLFEMLTGRPPYVGDALEVAAKHRTEPLPALAKLRPEINEATRRLVEHATAKQPADRFVDAVHFLGEAERILRGETTGIDLHPVLPEHDENRLFRADFSWQLDARPDQIWPFASNTERINCAVGVPSVEYETVQDRDLGVRKFGTFRMAGMEIGWEEHPFEWIEGQRLGVLRTFTSGPFEWFLSTVETLRNPTGGTHLKHTVRIAPRGLVGRLVAQLEVNIKGKPALDRVYGRIDKVVTGTISAHSGGTDPYQKSYSLRNKAQQRLDSCVQRLARRGVDSSTLQTLADYVATAPAQELARMRPKALAQQLDVDLDSLMTVCLYGVQEGLLQIHWDILCPTCRVSATVKDTLREIQSHAHCEFCDVNFDVDFGNSIELVFRTHPDIRQVDIGTYCIGGPEHAPHAVAQLRVAPNERIELNTQLDEGRYLLRGPQLPYTITVQVQRDRGATRADVVLSNRLSRGALEVAVRAGGQVLALTNDYDRPLLVRLERTAFRRDVLTAAEASRFSLFQELFPNESLREGELVSLAMAAFLVVKLPELHRLCADLGDATAYDVFTAVRSALGRVVRDHQGAIVRSADQVVATFECPLSAVQAALQIPIALADCMMSHRLRPQIAVHAGDALVTTTAEQIDYFGETLQLTMAMAAVADPDSLLVTEAVACDPEVDAAIQQSHWNREFPSIEDFPGLRIQRLSPRGEQT